MEFCYYDQEYCMNTEYVLQTYRNNIKVVFLYLYFEKYYLTSILALHTYHQKRIIKISNVVFIYSSKVNF